VLKAGLLKCQTFYDGRTARHEIPKLLDIVDRYNSGELKEGNVSVDSEFKHLVNAYLTSKRFLKLSGATQRTREYTLKSLLTVEVNSKPFGDYKVKDLNVKLCKALYSSLIDVGTVLTANYRLQVLSQVISLAVELELLVSDPIKAFPKETAEVKPQETWTKEQVERVLKVAYSEFKYRNLGLLIHMCYEWAQPTGLISKLTWDCFNWEENYVEIDNGNRVVYIPLEEPLRSMLLEQKRDWDFQPYVVTKTKPSGTVYKPLEHLSQNKALKELLHKAEIPEGLTLQGLRTTAIKEMIEAGVDSLSIIQVTGHKGVEGLSPYVDSTLSGAQRALTQRRNNNE